ncbi:MAG: MFS transporter [Eubacteriales bacterium]|nr:MFS transporter [Eubacteriales bacterium]
MKNNRIVYAIIGTIALLFAGLIYAWSVLSQPMKFEFSAVELSFAFTVCMASFCIGGLIGGITQKKINVRINMIISGILLFAGFYIASIATSAILLYLGYGIIAGFASGFVYNGVMSCVTKWFTDKPGLISGILLMGFGLGSFIIGKVYQAYTPAGEGIDIWRSSFFIFGIILVTVLILGSFFIKPVPEDYVISKPEKNSKIENNKDIYREEGIDATPAQMLKRVSFWLYFLWTVSLSAVGLILISQSSGILLEIAPNTLPATVATIVGLISIMNAVGRVICGFLFDKIGRRNTMFVVDFMFLLVIALLMFAIMSKIFILIIITFIVGGLAYGGVTPMNSAFISTFYGVKNYPVNFPIVNMNLMIASFGSTLAGAIYMATSSYLMVCYVMLGIALLATVASIILRRP